MAQLSVNLFVFFPPKEKE